MQQLLVSPSSRKAACTDNAEAPFYGVFGANRADIARPYFQPILEYARQHGGTDAAAYSANYTNNCSTNGGVGGMPGVIHMPGVIGQHGFEDHGDMSMHEDASFAVLNFISERSHGLLHIPRSCLTVCCCRQTTGATLRMRLS